MAARKVLIWPDPELKKISEPVLEVDAEVRTLVKDLIDTMYHEGDSAGIAAPQIGVHKRLFIIDIPPEHNDGNGTKGAEAFINPEIIEQEGSFQWEEGCLSIPGERGKVKRSYRVVMRYMDIEGKIHEREAFDYLAGAFQHELDHLNGVLWIDYHSKLKQSIVKKRMLKMKSRKDTSSHAACEHGCQH